MVAVVPVLRAHRGIEERQDAAAYHELDPKVQPQQRRQHERTQRAFELGLGLGLGLGLVSGSGLGLGTQRAFERSRCR